MLGRWWRAAAAASNYSSRVYPVPWRTNLVHAGYLYASSSRFNYFSEVAAAVPHPPEENFTHKTDVSIFCFRRFILFVSLKTFGK